MQENNQTCPHPVRQDLRNHGYEYLKDIGHGGYGDVYLVRSVKYRSNFAAKRCEIKPQSGKSCSKGHLDIKDSDTREIEALMNLDCPNVISFYDYFVEGDALFLILEFCEGGTIADLVANHITIDNHRLQFFCYQIANALRECHAAGIAHRDIKPANVFIDSFNRPKLADFGISMKFQSGDKTNRFGGTLQYMSPEMLTDPEYDPYPADIWALGILFYIIATGKYPFSFLTRDDLEKAILSGKYNRLKTIDPRLVDLLDGMLIVDPSRRIQIQEVISHRFLTEVPQKERPIPTPSYAGLGKRVFSTSKMAPFNRRHLTLSYNRTFLSLSNEMNIEYN